MTTVRGLYYDGRRSAPDVVSVEVAPQPGGRARLRVIAENGEIRGEFDRVRVEDQIGRSSRLIELPGGAMLEIGALPSPVGGHGEALRSGWLHALESRWSIALSALAVTVAVVVFAMKFGIPALARHAVDVIPADLDADIGEGGLQLLDERYLSASRLTASRQEQLAREFAAVASDLNLHGQARLVLRQGGKLQANAFALPSGIVVATDELVELAEHDDELRAVFAHELGHVQGRHSLRMLLQSSANAALMVGVFGDIGTATTLTASVPTVLVHAANSRDFEREADDCAKAWMRRRGIPVSRLGDLLTRLELRYGNRGWSYLSSHPPLAERLKD